MFSSLSPYSLLVPSLSQSLIGLRKDCISSVGLVPYKTRQSSIGLSFPVISCPTVTLGNNSTIAKTKMTVSSDSTEMIREGEITPHSVAPSPQFGSHVVEKAEEEAGMAEEALNNEEFHLIEEIQNLNLAEDDVPPFVAPLPEEDPMIFHPLYYGGANGEFTPCVTPPEPASDYVFPPDMAQAIPWHPIGAPMQPFDPEMPPQLIAYPPGWGEMPPGCVPAPLDVSQQNLAYHAYPIFQPIPTFVGQPFFHRRNGSAPGTPNRNGNGGGNGNHALRECYNCRRPGHLARNCGEVASDKQCFHCLKFGHVVRNCPQTRNHQNANKRDGFPDPRLNGSLSSSPTYLEWSSDSGDPSSGKFLVSHFNLISFNSSCIDSMHLPYSSP